MIGFYGPTKGWGKLVRIAAIAQHISAPVRVYTIEGSANCTPLDWHGVDWVAVGCSSPGCGGVTPSVFASSIEQDALDMLVMDAWPYGGMTQEMRHVVESRQPASNVFVARRNPVLEAEGYGTRPFGRIFNVEPGLIGGEDMWPVMAFDDTDILPRVHARGVIGTDFGRPTVLLVPSIYSQPDLHKFVRDTCAKYGVHCVDWEGYPLMPFLTGPDLVIGFAGTVANEAKVVGVPYLVAASRSAADHQVRANTTAAQIEEAIKNLEVIDEWTVSYENNARAIAEAIAGPAQLRNVYLPSPPPVVGKIGDDHA